MYLQVQVQFQPKKVPEMIQGQNRAEFTFVEHRDLNIESEINSVSLDFI